MAGEETERPGEAVPKTTRVARRPAAKRVSKRAPKRTGVVRWSQKREDRFLATLAQTSNVAASARAAGLSDSTIYRRRQKSEAFRAAWAAALREGFARLEEMLLDRALNGVEKPVWHGGKQVGTLREYSDRLALALLHAHRPSVTGVEPAADPAASDEELKVQLLQRLADMNLRMGGDG